MRKKKMPFRLRQEAVTFFKHIRPNLSMDFDMYYFCLMAGLALMRKEEVPSAQTNELVDSFPGEYRPKGRIIVAVFLTRELTEMGISRSNRSALHMAIGQLIDPLSPSHLSDLGLKELNKYAHGGYNVLTEWFNDHPRVFEAFLPLYKQKIDAAIGNQRPSGL
jgi:hypothetical protein